MQGVEWGTVPQGDWGVCGGEGYQEASGLGETKLGCLFQEKEVAEHTLAQKRREFQELTTHVRGCPTNCSGSVISDEAEFWGSQTALTQTGLTIRPDH